MSYYGDKADICRQPKHIVDGFFCQDTVIGYIGLWAIVANCVCVVVVSRCVDYLRGKMKLILLTLSAVAFFCWVWLGLICLRVIPFSLGKCEVTYKAVCAIN